jgi:hypothetical protein
MSSIAGETVMTVIQPYEDKLVHITGQYIVFQRYYFPFGSKEVLVSEIEYITVLQPSMANGSWRIWGTGDFSTWFPCDWRRPKRDVIFRLKLKDRSRYIGFTVEDSWAVLSLFREMGLLRNEPPSQAITSAR